MSVTINIPREGNVMDKATGDVAILAVTPDHKVKFVLQYTSDDKEIAHLVHYASGIIVINASTINNRRVQRFMNGGKLSVRQAASIILLELVERVGAETLLSKMAAAPVINA